MNNSAVMQQSMVVLINYYLPSTHTFISEVIYGYLLLLFIFNMQDSGRQGRLQGVNLKAVLLPFVHI